MIPVIQRFRNDGHQVVMAGTGRSAELLKSAFPDLLLLSLPSAVIRLGEGLLSTAGLALQVPGMIFSAFREHFLVRKIVGNHHIDIVVSDNRYGLFCNLAYTVFVTHQISPVLPRFWRWLEYPLYRVIRRIILQYDVCWIPDSGDPEMNLSGKLSHRYTLPSNARFTGILSRFCDFEPARNSGPVPQFDLVAVMSGPEPQVTSFESHIRQQLHNLPVKALIIRGMRGTNMKLPGIREGGVTLVSHLETGDFIRILLQAKLVLCRAGYSGIMDLACLGIQAILVPTPGQTEQEYLAAHLAHMGWFGMVRQRDLYLNALLKQQQGSQLPGWHQYPRINGPDQYRDLYRKYNQHGEKAYQES